MEPKTEAGIQAAIRLAIGRIPHAYIIRRNVGMFRLYRPPFTPIFIGQEGEPDLQGIVGNQLCQNCGVPIHPLPFGIEVKTAKEKQRKTQINYQNNIWERRGGLYIIARSIQDALKGLRLL